MRLYRIGLVAQAVLYLASGINHFWHEPFYRHIMPDHYRSPDALVKISGIAEILGGIGLLAPATRRAAAACIVVMLLIFLDVHQFMLRYAGRFPGVPKSVLWARLLLQVLLIAWAIPYTKRKADRDTHPEQPLLNQAR